MILESNINGGRQVIENCRMEGVEAIKVFIAADAKVLAQHLKERGDSMADIVRGVPVETNLFDSERFEAEAEEVLSPMECIE